MTNETDSEVIAELLELDEERCRAISEQRWNDLDRLLDDDLTHTHLNGATEDKSTYIENMKSGARHVEREGVRVRLYGDVAVMNGRQLVSMTGEDGESIKFDQQALQVWVKRDTGWRQVAFQVSGARV